jgi:hypothetical protein
MVSILVVGTNTYVTRAQANTYLGDSFAWATNWDALLDTQKDQALLSAFRLLEKQDWEGTPTTATAHFPAEGVTDCLGTAIVPPTVPPDIEAAQIELAYAISQNPDLEDAVTTDDNTRRLQAGSASIEFFNRDGSLIPTRFPGNVMELIKCYLRSSSASCGPEAIGATGESLFDDCDGYDRNLPF